jgi:hypothetical protein
MSAQAVSKNSETKTIIVFARVLIEMHHIQSCDIVRASYKASELD